MEFLHITRALRALQDAQRVDAEVDWGGWWLLYEDMNNQATTTECACPNAVAAADKLWEERRGT